MVLKKYLAGFPISNIYIVLINSRQSKLNFNLTHFSAQETIPHTYRKDQRGHYLFYFPRMEQGRPPKYLRRVG